MENTPICWARVRPNCLSDNPLVFWPLRITEPEEGESSSPIRLRRVDFPDPEGPAKTVNSPLDIDRLIPLRAVTSRSPRGYVFTMSLREQTFILILGEGYGTSF